MFSCSVKFTSQLQLSGQSDNICSPLPVIRRAMLAVDHNDPITFAKVMNLARELYNIDADMELELTWIDEDNDVVTMSTDLEFNEYLRYVSVTYSTGRHQLQLLKLGLLAKNSYKHVKEGAISNVQPETQRAPCSYGMQHVLAELKSADKPFKLRKTNIIPLIVNNPVSQVYSPFKARALDGAIRHYRITEKPSVSIMRNVTGELVNISKITAKKPIVTCHRSDLNKAIQSAANAKKGSGVVLIAEDPGTRCHHVTPGSTFRHSWSIQNAGTEDCTNITLQYVDGAEMKIAGASQQVAGTKYPVGNIKAGSSKRIVMNLVAPSQPGLQITHFQLFSNSNKVGPALTVRTDSLLTNELPRAAAVLTGDAEFCLSTPSAVALPAPPSSTFAPKIPLNSDEITVPSSVNNQNSAPSWLPITMATSPMNAEGGKPVTIAQRNIASTPSIPSMESQPYLTAFEHEKKEWAAELAVLADMGFCDFEEVIPLLQKHVKIPSRAVVGKVSNLSNSALNQIVTNLIRMRELKEVEDSMSNNCAIIDIGSSESDAEM